MLFSIHLQYIRPAADINLHLDAHRQWLIEHVRAGRIIVAGPLEPRTGGLVIACCADVPAMRAMMEQDPFIAQQVASYRTLACQPALIASGFAAGWAPDAKTI